MNTPVALKVQNLIAAALMFFFAIPKLLGLPASLEGFEQFKSLVPLDPDVFRIFTGIVELVIAILLAVVTFKAIRNLSKLSYFLLLSTMLGGLVMEFFARPKPEIMLVVIAIVLSVLSIYRLRIDSAN